MTAIPNSFSMDDLEKMLENAQAETETEVDTTEDFSEETILSLCDAITDLMQEKSNGPLLPKCVAVTVLNHLIQWQLSAGGQIPPIWYPLPQYTSIGESIAPFAFASLPRRTADFLG